MHRTRTILILFLSLVLFGLTGCRPKGILHSGEMRAILADLHKTDGIIQISGLQYGHDEEVDIYYAQVLEKHGVTQAQFDSSIVWYTAHPVLFDKIYPKVRADLKAEHEAFKELYAAELNLHSSAVSDASSAEARPFTVIELDSVLWVCRHGYPSTWNAWPQPMLPYRK